MENVVYTGVPGASFLPLVQVAMTVATELECKLPNKGNFHTVNPAAFVDECEDYILMDGTTVNVASILSALLAYNVYPPLQTNQIFSLLNIRLEENTCIVKGMILTIQHIAAPSKEEV